MKRFAGREITPYTIFKMLSLLLCFCRVGDAYGQNTVYGSVADKNAAPLAGVHVLLYPVGDSINHVAIDVTDTLGVFRLPLIPDGKYQLVTKYIGMKTVFQSLTVSGKDLAVDTIRMQEADNRLGEVAVKAKIPEWTIMRPHRSYGPVHFSEDYPYQTSDHRVPIFSDFEGRWQWKSAHGDTILTLELFNVQYITINRRYVPNYWTTYRILNNNLVGRYEYQIGDSVLFSSMDTPVKKRETFYYSEAGRGNDNPLHGLGVPPSSTGRRQAGKNERKRNLLFSVIGYNMPPNSAQIRQMDNPFSRHRAWITLTFINKERTAIFWHTDVFMRYDPQTLYIRKALKGELGLPDRIVLRKIVDVKKNKKRRKKRE